MAYFFKKVSVVCQNFLVTILHVFRSIRLKKNHVELFFTIPLTVAKVFSKLFLFISNAYLPRQVCVEKESYKQKNLSSFYNIPLVIV